MNAVILDEVKLVSVPCCVCDTAVADVIGRALDFEYFSCPNQFNFNRCRECGNVYLNPRPAVSEFKRIYPPNYYAFDFSEKSYGLVHKIRSRLEANRLLSYCKGIPDNAKILDLGCGVGFHLNLLKQYGGKNWILEGLDLDSRVVEIAIKNGLTVHCGTVEDIDLGKQQYDLVYTIQTIEHVAQPDKVFSAIYHILKPGGRLVVVTDNTDSLDFSLFKRRHWGGVSYTKALEFIQW